MRNSLIGLAAAAGIGLGSVAAPAPANAQCWGCAVGAGVLGGVIIGSAIANGPPPPPPGYYPPPPPAPPPGYYGSGAYYAPGYAQGAPGCWWEKRRVWVEGVGYRVRPIQVCQ